MSGSCELTSREAVEAVELAFVRDLRICASRRRRTTESTSTSRAAVDGVPNGRMLGVQINGGASFFSETAGDGVVFRSEERHLKYWLGHSLPVVVALYDPGDQAILWRAVTPETAQSTGKGWELVVPRAQRLDASSAPALQELVEGDSYTLGLNALRADLGWMRLLRDGGRVWVEVEEWVKKSSGRGSITLIGRPAGGRERLERARGVYLGLLPYDQVIPIARALPLSPGTGSAAPASPR